MFRVTSGGFSVIGGTMRVNAPLFPTVTIGTQVWMTQNLDVTTYRNGDVIPEVTSSVVWNSLNAFNDPYGAWCYYNNDPANGAIYGKLYNWHTVNDPRGIGPVGWHVPTNTEIGTLITFLGGDSVTGGKMKSTGTSLWDSPNTSATNTSGFSGFPGGQRAGLGDFLNLRQFGFFWTSTDGGGGGNVGWEYYLALNSAAIVRTNSNGKQFGKSVRLIKD
jgi:uncharacterized protein (TIGR02145 family)